MLKPKEENSKGDESNHRARSILRVEGLVYRSGRLTLLDKLSFELERSPITVIMGANGAGKSILLRLLHGLILPSEGSIYWNGHPVSSATRLRQAMLFQKPVLLRRSVMANLSFVHKGNSEERVQLLQKVGLYSQAHRPARSLSGGEQQRLALARALAIKPEVILLDEPTTNLDPSSLELVENMLQDAKQNGRKIILVTHDIGQAKRIADEVLFLHRGIICEFTASDEFFAQPRSREAQDYLQGKLLL